MPAAPASALTKAFDPRVDLYIAKAQPFAQPILEHLREAVHHAVPHVTEDIKWSMPFFIFDGLILANMAGFKQHCSFGFWGAEVNAQLHADGLFSREGMGTLGKLKSIADLPRTKDLHVYLQTAASVIADGTRTRNYTRPPRGTRPDPPMPAAFAAALKKNKAATANFAAFPPGCRREYIDWIATAQREATRAARVDRAIALIAEGKRSSAMHARH